VVAVAVLDTPVGPEGTLHRRPHHPLLTHIRLASLAGQLSPSSQLVFRCGSDCRNPHFVSRFQVIWSRLKGVFDVGHGAIECVSNTICGACPRRRFSRITLSLLLFLLLQALNRRRR